MSKKGHYYQKYKKYRLKYRNLMREGQIDDKSSLDNKDNDVVSEERLPIEVSSKQTAVSNEINIHDVICIGSGPAGYTAAIYAARANLRPLLFEGNTPGGQLVTTKIENFPGFADGIDGFKLMQEMKKQCINYGCKVYPDDVTRVDLQEYPYKVYATDRVFTTKSIIIATGATAKTLELPNGSKFWGNGISACAVCEASSPIFKNKPIAVVGGGDSACEEALYLSKFGSIIYLIVRSNKMRASKIMQDRVLGNSKIKMMYNTEIVDVKGDKVLEGIKVVNNQTKKVSEISSNGLFYAIGHSPNVKFLENQIELDENGYIKANNTFTNVKGVFAAGDVQDHIYRQAITAAGSGCMAALECEKFLAFN